MLRVQGARRKGGQPDQGEGLNSLGPPSPLRPLASFHFARGICALEVGDLNAAEGGFQRCVKAKADHALGLYHLGKIRFDQNRVNEALEHLTRAVVADPGHVEARFTLGLAARRAGRLENAVGFFTKVLEQTPGHAGAKYNLGRALLESGNKEEGRRTLAEFRALSQLQDEIDFKRHAVERARDNAEARVEFARLLLRAGKIREAAEELQKAARIRPSAETFRWLAQAFRLQGRHGEAAQAQAYADRLTGDGG